MALVVKNPPANIQFSSVAQSCPTLCDPMGCSSPGLTHIVACVSTSLLTVAERCYTVWLFVCPVAQLCSTLCDPMDYSMPGFLVLHHLPEFGQTHFHWVGDAIQSPHPLSPPSPPALNLSEHQGLFHWTGSSHQVARVASFIHWSMDIWVVSTL